MHTLMQTGAIMCGDHYLNAKVTFTEYRYAKYIDGHSCTLAEEPEVTIKCMTCGREATAHQFVVNTEMTDRIFP